MNIFAILGALVIGLSLGLLGAGGSILTVPVLVYLLHEPPKIALMEALGIVAGISWLGTWQNIRLKVIHWPSVWRLGLPSLIGAAFGAGLGQHLAASVQMALFATVMLMAAVMMWREQAIPVTTTPTTHRPWWLVFMTGLMLGLITGLVGVGGGFLLIPALVLVQKLSMPQAVASSLPLIALQSSIGFLGYWLPHPEQLQHPFLIVLFIIFGVIGLMLGRKLGHWLAPIILRRSFSGLLILLAGYIIVSRA